MMTIDDEQRAAIAAKLAGMTLPSGLGNEHNACSIAAINLALTGELTDDIPDCMSAVIGEWVIVVQDSMPAALRNSHRWKALLPLAAGTGREHERERLTLVLKWMWETALPIVQPLADARGFGLEWQRMTDERSVDAARAAWAEASGVAGRAAEDIWDAADAAARAAAWTAAAWQAAIAAKKSAAAVADAWESFDPCDLLERLIDEGSAE